jgi:hypothetical protein
MILKNASRAQSTLVQIAGVRQPQDAPLSRIIDAAPSAQPSEESFTRP